MPFDIYKHIAAEALGIKADDVTQEQRQFAKEKTWILLYAGGKPTALQPNEADANQFEQTLQDAINYLAPQIKLNFSARIKTPNSNIIYVPEYQPIKHGFYVYNSLVGDVAGPFGDYTTAESKLLEVQPRDADDLIYNYIHPHDASKSGFYWGPDDSSRHHGPFDSYGEAQTDLNQYERSILE